MTSSRTRLLIGALAFVTLAGCSTADEPAADPACTTSLEVTTPDGQTATLTSAIIQTVDGGAFISVFAADFPIEDHDAPGQIPRIPTDDGQMVWIELGDPDPRNHNDAPVLGSGDTVTLPGTGRAHVTASRHTADRMDRLFGDPFGSIDLQRLEDDGACVDIDVTIAGVQIRGTAAAESVLRGE